MNSCSHWLSPPSFISSLSNHDYLLPQEDFSSLFYFIDYFTITPLSLVPYHQELGVCSLRGLRSHRAGCKAWVTFRLCLYYLPC